MSSAAVASVAVQGAQLPRVSSIPQYASSTGGEAVELAAYADLHLDPWQAFVLKHAFGERPDGKWAAFEVGVLVSRQNGKGSILEARELAGLFLLDERLIVHSAHQFDTSLEAFRRLLELIEGRDEFSRRVKRVSRAHGEEGIELYGPTARRVTGGQRIRFRTRTKGGGRGFSGDCLVLDEAMVLPESFHGAILPILSARPNPQVWYAGSAVDQSVHEHGIVFARVRERGHAGDDPALAFFEWSLDVDIDRATDAAIASDPKSWAQANPGLGIRISTEYVAAERRALDTRSFAVERLGVGDWPRTDGAEHVIDLEAWGALTDTSSQPRDPVCFAFDVTPDRSCASIGVAGKRQDGLDHVEVVEQGRGTGWVADAVAGLKSRHRGARVVCDASGPAGSLLSDLAALGVDVITVNAKEHAQACGMLFDGVADRTVRHLGTPELLVALDGAVKRPLGDAWAWSRKSSSIDISPLVACTLALWGVRTRKPHSSRVVSLADAVAAAAGTDR